MVNPILRSLASLKLNIQFSTKLTNQYIIVRENTNQITIVMPGQFH